LAPGGGLWPQLSLFVAQQIPWGWCAYVSSLGPTIGLVTDSSAVLTAQALSLEHWAQNHLLLPSLSTSLPGTEDGQMGVTRITMC
jgi:hypothetical protein